MRVERFDDDAAETISTWARSIEEGRAWCSMTEVRVLARVVVDWAGDSNTEAYVLRDTPLTPSHVVYPGTMTAAEMPVIPLPSSYFSSPASSASCNS